MIEIDGRFWLNKDGHIFLGNGRIELLELIASTGSMHAAAKEMKMSYKAAWDRVNSMNALADYPIIEKTTGGKGGGGTILTPYAYELIATYKRFSELHRQFIQRFSEAGDNPEHLARILARTFLTTSARNQLPCKVVNITDDELKGTLSLVINDTIKLNASITLKSIQDMGITKDCDVYAIIKSSDIQISSTPPTQAEHINVLEGEIKKIETSKENIEIVISIDKNVEFVSIMSKKDATALQITQKAYAIIPYENILIGL